MVLGGGLAAPGKWKVKVHDMKIKRGKEIEVKFKIPLFSYKVKALCALPLPPQLRAFIQEKKIISKLLGIPWTTII